MTQYKLAPTESTLEMRRSGQRAWLDSAGADPSEDVYKAMLEAAPEQPRPVTPYTCPKCHALWLHWPKEQTGFSKDTLNCRSSKWCDYCEKADLAQLERLERTPATLTVPEPPVQEPVAVKAMGYGGITGINDYLMSDGSIKAMRPREVVWATVPQQAPQQPVQEPVAWGNFTSEGTLVGLSQHTEDQTNWQGRKPLFTAPPDTDKLLRRALEALDGKYGNVADRLDAIHAIRKHLGEKT